MPQSFLITAKSEQARQDYIADFCQQKGIGKYDQMLVIPEEESLGIAQVRLAQKTAYLAPLQSPEKAIIFTQAHTLTLDAQNALLKLLEEPPVHTYIFLSANTQQAFLPTILSRCTIVELDKAQSITISEEAKEQLQQDLALLQTGTLGDKLALAEKRAKKEELDSWLTNSILLLRDKMLAQPEEPTYVIVLKQLQEARRLLQTTNVAPREILEHIFLTL